MDGLAASVGKELRSLPRRLGGASGMVFYAAVVLLLGVVLPLRLGLEFLDSMVLFPICLTSGFFSGPVVVEAVSGPGLRRNRSELYARVIAGLLVGKACTAAILITGVVLINQTSRFRGAAIPELTLLFSLGVLGVSMAIFAGGLAAMLALDTRNASSLKNNLRRAFLLLLVLAVYFVRRLPGEWVTNAGMSQLALLLSIPLLCGGLVMTVRAAKRWAEPEAEQVRLHLTD